MLLYIHLFHDFSNSIFQLGMRFNYSDWLTNYSAGFIRRGLAGTVISWFQNTDSAVFNFFVIVFLLNMILILLWTFFFKVYKVPNSVFILWCFLPGAVFGNLIQAKFYYRKEYFFLFPVLLLAIAIRLSLQKVISQRVFYCFFIGTLGLSVMALLHHEAFFLIALPCMVAMAIKHWSSRPELKSHHWTLLMSLVVLVATFVLLIAFKGTKAQGEQLFFSLSPVDQKIIFDPKIKFFINDGQMLYDRVYRAFSVFGSSPQEEMMYVYGQIVQTGQLSQWMFIYLGVVLQFVFLVGLLFRKSWKDIFNPALVYFLQSVISMPIFLMSEDWGRWMSINFQMCFIAFVVTKDTHRKANTILVPITVLALILFCFLKTMTQLPECCLFEPQSKAPLLRLLLWLGVNVDFG